jgi:hypothetical protein
MRGIGVSLVSLAALTGCSSLEGYARHPDTLASITAKRDAYFGSTTLETQYYASNTDAVTRRRLRDQIVYGRMDVIDFDFDNLERELNSAGNGVSLGGDLAVLIANGIGSVTGGKQTKAALNAVSGGIVGAQGAINKDLYYQRTLPALLNQMEANRDKVKATILSGLKKPDDSYPLGAAQLDLRQLVRAGSIPASVGEITEKATTDKQASERLVERARTGIYVSTPASERLDAWLAPNGIPDSKRMATFQDWLNAQPETFLRQLPIAAIVSEDMPELEAIRKRAVADTALAIPR